MFLKFWQFFNSEVTLVNADGSDLVNLTDSLGLARPEFPLQPFITWSPDGNRVAFTRSDGALYGTTGSGDGVVQLAHSASHRCGRGTAARSRSWPPTF